MRIGSRWNTNCTRAFFFYQKREVIKDCSAYIVKAESLPKRERGCSDKSRKNEDKLAKTNKLSGNVKISCLDS